MADVHAILEDYAAGMFSILQLAQAIHATGDNTCLALLWERLQAYPRLPIAPIVQAVAIRTLTLPETQAFLAAERRPLENIGKLVPAQLAYQYNAQRLVFASITDIRWHVIDHDITASIPRGTFATGPDVTAAFRAAAAAANPELPLEATLLPSRKISIAGPFIQITMAAASYLPPEAQILIYHGKSTMFVASAAAIAIMLAGMQGVYTRL